VILLVLDSFRGEPAPADAVKTVPAAKDAKDTTPAADAERA
jgi:hypothetical protein